MKVTHNSSFVHQPRDIMVDWAKTNKQAEFEFPTSKKKKKSEPGVREICGQMPKRQLTVGVFGWAQECLRSFFVWPGLAQTTVLPQTQ